MHECLLCERDMKKSKNEFGSGCINNIYKFLDIEKPKRGKNKELLLYKNIMQRTKISKINKEQKIWLTDRYLTYQYLNKLKYGDFEKLKKQINEDIENVGKIEKFEEMITARKIKLKEAYDLYKKEAKFETNLSKIKNNEYEEDKNIKLLITSFSFIFNIHKNKNQNEIINKYKTKNEFNISVEDKESMTFENSDLYFAIHKAKIEMKAKKEDDKTWNAEVVLSDTFDFTKWKGLLEYIKDADSISKSMLSSTLYNLAFISQNLGIIKEYEVVVKLPIKVVGNAIV